MGGLSGEVTGMSCIVRVTRRRDVGELPDIKMDVLYPVATPRALGNRREQNRWETRVA